VRARGPNRLTRPEPCRSRCTTPDDDRPVDKDAGRQFRHAGEASGAHFEHYAYPTAAHLFADPDLPDVDPDLADLMLDRASPVNPVEQAPSVTVIA
jgi:hypothetical protein